MKLELARLLLSRQEQINETVVREWINSFKELNYSCKEVLLRIKVAKISKRYGNYTTLADFTDCDEDLYSKKYSEIYEIIEYCENCSYYHSLGHSTKTLQDCYEQRKEHTCGHLFEYKYQ